MYATCLFWLLEILLQISIFKLIELFNLISFLFRSKMMRASSALIRRSGGIENQMEHQSQKNKMLEEDRRHFLRQADEIKEKYHEEIESLKNENKKLKAIRDQFINSKKTKTIMPKEFKSTGFNAKCYLSSNNQNYLKITLDKEKHETKKKKQLLFTLQDKLKDIEENKLGFIEENPMMKTIRTLENKLDKVMIKYNQVQSLQQTYEQVVSRLKEERIGYDCQLVSIQNCLKGKEQDFEQLLLLSHDAAHAKEAAYTDLKRFQQRIVNVQEMRAKYISQQVEEINKDKDKPLSPEISTRGERSTQKLKTTIGFGTSYKHDENYQKQQLHDYQDAFRKLKKITGVSDANEIIQKFKTQGLTSGTLQELQSTYSKKIENLKKAKQELRAKLNQNKFIGESKNPERLRMDQIDTQITNLNNQFQRTSFKYEKISTQMTNVTAGINHLMELSAFFRLQNVNYGGTLEDKLKMLDGKLTKIYSIIKSDSNYVKISYKITLNAIQAIMGSKKFQQKFGFDQNNKDDCIEEDGNIMI